MTFASLGLSEPILRAVSELGYTTPTPIQAQAIPAVLAGGDLLAGAQTGTGKTAGFTLPILQHLSAHPGVRAPNGKAPIRVLVLVPTRELAAQVEESVRDYGKYLRVNSMVMFGGVNINPQIRQLKDRVDILVATPGRLLDHAGQRTVDLSHVEILVLDEADRMLDMGFIRDIKKVLALLPKKRQNLLFSATFSDEIKELADGLLDRPALIEVARRNATAELVTQRVMLVDRNRKRELLSRLVTDGNWHQVLVFTRTKHGANRLAEQLNKDGITAMAIHGNKSQGARTRALSEFKDGSLQVLVATDIAARGLDISELPHVVNYELPNVPEDYVHRIGRTGRAGASGEAISLVCIDEFKFLADIEKLTKRTIERETVAGFELDPNDRPEPIELGGMRGRTQQRRGSAPAGGGRAAGGRGDGRGDGRGQRSAETRGQGGDGRRQGGDGRDASRGGDRGRAAAERNIPRRGGEGQSTGGGGGEPRRAQGAARPAEAPRAPQPTAVQAPVRPAPAPAARPQQAAAVAAPARPRGWGRGPGGGR